MKIPRLTGLNGPQGVRSARALCFFRASPASSDETESEKELARDIVDF